MTYHSIVRTEERARMNQASAIRMISRAKARGQESGCFPAKERKYLEVKELYGMHALYYTGFCFIFNEEYKCVTMFPVPIWFGKKINYRGKEQIRSPKKYSRNNLDVFEETELNCFA